MRELPGLWPIGVYRYVFVRVGLLNEVAVLVVNIEHFEARRAYGDRRAKAVVMLGFRAVDLIAEYTGHLYDKSRASLKRNRGKLFSYGRKKSTEAL
jgi:hypothetical protein